MSTFAEEIKEELPEIPLEKIFENLLIELPVLLRGVPDITYFINEEERTIMQNKMNEFSTRREYYVSEIAALVSFHKII